MNNGSPVELCARCHHASTLHHDHRPWLCGLRGCTCPGWKEPVNGRTPR